MNTIYVLVNSGKIHPSCHKSEAFFYPPNEHTLLSIILERDIWEGRFQVVKSEESVFNCKNMIYVDIEQVLPTLVFGHLILSFGY